MKLILCTLAVCCSFLLSVATTQSVVRDEGKRTRVSVSKGQAESSAGADLQEPLAQKLDALNNQLSNLNRRMSVLEEALKPDESAHSSDPSQNMQSTLLALRRELSGVSSALARLNGVPGHLAELTVFLDKSFDHLEKTAAANATPETTLASLDAMTQKIDAIDSYFTPLYAFLGLVYDPANDGLMAGYPTVDERINELYLQQQAIRQDIADFRYMMTPRNIEPVKRPR